MSLGGRTFSARHHSLAEFFFFFWFKKKKRFTVDLSETKEAGSVMKSARVGPTRGHFLLLQRPGEGEVKHLWHAALLVQRQLSASPSPPSSPSCRSGSAGTLGPN